MISWQRHVSSIQDPRISKKNRRKSNLAICPHVVSAITRIRTTLRGRSPMRTHIHVWVRPKRAMIQRGCFCELNNYRSKREREKKGSKGGVPRKERRNNFRLATKSSPLFSLGLQSTSSLVKKEKKKKTINTGIHGKKRKKVYQLTLPEPRNPINQLLSQSKKTSGIGVWRFPPLRHNGIGFCFLCKCKSYSRVRPPSMPSSGLWAGAGELPPRHVDPRRPRSPNSAPWREAPCTDCQCRWCRP